MRPFAFVPLALSCLAVAPAAAQTGPEANLVLTILGGVATGHELWTVEKQPLCVLIPAGGQYTCGSNVDTLRLSRGIGSSIVLGTAATYFPSPHVGFHVELSYLGLPLDNACTGVSYDGSVSSGDTYERNRQTCDDIQSQAGTGSAVVIFGGVTLRATPRRALSPYLRGSVGVVNQSRSMVEVVGAFVDPSGFHERQVVADPRPRATSAMLGGAAGFTSPLGTGYQFRLEVRDVVARLDRLTGSANGLGIGPTASRFYHHIALTLALDVVLEKKRGRRY